ncbi:MAG: cell division protein ZapD [Pseudomonadota bacterium]|nr:MAG: cell division protein ZapD [Pseudomonadota bacterium]
MQDIITYEQPLNERIRMFLRLDHLFRKTTATLEGTSSWDSRTTMGGLIAILELLSRTDVKNEILKDLERHQITLSRLQTKAGVDHDMLQKTLDELERYSSQLHAIDTPLGLSLRDTDLIAGLTQRGGMIESLCSFDVPAYHFWLSKPAEERVTQQKAWFHALQVVEHPIRLLVSIIRESTVPASKVAVEGFYQQSLSTNSPYLLLRVILPASAPYFAEISAGKHRFTVRFMQPRANQRPLQYSEDVEFKLSCCAL